MKKIFITIILVLGFTWNVFAAGTINQTVTDVPETTVLAATKVVTFTCVGDSSGGSFPSTALSAANLEKISGMYIVEVRTYPQTTNPTAAWDAVINDAGGLDLMGGTLANRSASAAERAIPAMATSIYGGSPIIDAPTLVITGNSVNSAGIIIKVILSR